MALQAEGMSPLSTVAFLLLRLVDWEISEAFTRFGS